MIDQVKFVDVCRVLDRVEKTRGSAKKQDVFVAFFSSIPALLTEHAFPLLRLLAPKFDREKTYGISVKKIAALYVDANAWPAQGQKAKRLYQWADKKQETKASGVSNFTNVLEAILREEGLTQESVWAVAEVNQFLDELKDMTSHAERLPLWRRLSLQLTSAIEHKWLMRVILKDLKLGIGDNAILSTFHPSAVDWYNVSSDLHLVCTQALQHSTVHPLSSPTASAVTISPDSPIRPMLAARVLWGDVEEQLKTGHWAVELKFDGERCLIHKTGSRFRFFSRNQIDLSERYPDYLTAMEPYLRNNITAESCILDGELVVWDDVLGGYASFGTNRVVAAGQIPNCHLAYVAFDIVYLDGKVPIDLPLRERRQMLQKCIPVETPHRFEISKQEVIEKAEQIMTALDHAVDQGNEGLLVKNTDSLYTIGARDKHFWMKMKADYLLSDAMCDTMDLIILGVYFGKRDSFLLGVSNPDNLDDQGHPKSFYTYLHCGNGFTQDEHKMVLERLEPHYRAFEKGSPPTWFEPLPTQFTPPNVAVDPSHSLILEIKGFEIHKTNKQSCGYTVRFPVTVRIRTDKLWYESWTLNDIVSIVSGPNGGRICYNVREKLLSAFQPVKKASTAASSRILASLPSRNFGKVDLKSTLFEDLRIHVRSGTPKYSTTYIQKLILAHGGELVLNLTKDTAKKVDVVIIGDKTVQVENLIQLASEDPEFDIDIVRLQWAEDSIAQSKRCLYFPWYWVHLSQQTRRRLNSIMDVDIGIVWGHRPDQETCKRIYSWYRLRSLPNAKDGAVSSAHGLKRFRVRFDSAMYNLLWTPSTFFRDVVAYCLPKCGQAESHGVPCGPAKMIGNCIKVYSGRKVNKLTADVTHVVTCDSSNFQWRKANDGLLPEILKFAKVVDKRWLDHCLQIREDMESATVDSNLL